MKKLLNLSVFMCIVSIVALTDSTVNLITSLVVGAIVWVFCHYIQKLIVMIHAVHDHMLAQVQRDCNTQKDIARIDTELKQLDCDLKEQIEKLDHKFDRIISELKHTRK